MYARQRFREVPVPSRRQGAILYAMLNSDVLPRLKEHCMAAIGEVAQTEEDRRMLLEYVSTEGSAFSVAQKYFCTERRLQRLFVKYIRRVYENICLSGNG